MTHPTSPLHDRIAEAQAERWRVAVLNLQNISVGHSESATQLLESFNAYLLAGGDGAGLRTMTWAVKHVKDSPVEDDFGDASIQRAMIAARARGDEPTENKSRLVTEAEVREAASEIFDEDGVDHWFGQRLGMLDGMTPREAIAAGNGKRVLAIIDGLADGVVW